MVKYEGVQGSLEASAPLIVGLTTVYVHTNVTKVLDDEGQETGLYQYDEVQYDKDEYIKLMSETDTANRADIDYLLLLSEF